MLPYLYIFAACIVTCAFVCRSSRREGAGFIIVSIVIVLALSLFAGIRSISVGTDTAGYAAELYKLAESSRDFASFYGQNWIRAWGWSSVDTIEIGYLVLVWVSAKLGSFQILLFLTSLLTVGPIYLALALKRRELSLPLGLFIFLFLYFNVTLNAMRQWVAMALIFLALVGVYNPSRFLGKQPAVLLLLIGAYFFHTSAVLCVIPFLLACFLKRGSIRFRLCLVVVFSACILLGVNFFRSLLLNYGFVRYANYFGDGTLHISIPQIVLRLPFLVVACYLFITGKMNKREAAFYICMASLGIICGQFSTLTDQSGRIGQYFDIYILPAAGALASSSNQMKADTSLLNKKITSSSLLVAVVAIYSIVYWFYAYVLMGSGETIPYTIFWS